jgi:regulatory protein
MSEPTAPGPADIRNAAVDLLARREHSYKELLTKLARRFDDTDLIEQELGKLAEADLQSDRRFCEVFVRSKCQQGQGPQRIGLELKQRGINEALIRELLWDADIDWYELLQQLYDRRFLQRATQKDSSQDPEQDQPRDHQDYQHNQQRKAAEQKERAKRIRFLQYRGFGFELIRQVMAEE